MSEHLLIRVFRMGRRKKITDEEMILGARKCFLEHGPQVSTTIIAKCVGVSQAAIFKRFSTKEKLLLAALAPPVEVEWTRILDDGPDERPFREQLTEVATILDDFENDIFPRIHLLRAAGFDFHKFFEGQKYPPPVQIIQALTSWFGRAQKKGLIRKVNNKSLAYVLLGSIQSRAFLQHIMDSPNLRINNKTHVRNVVELVWQGIAPEGVK